MQRNVVQMEDARLPVPDGGIASFVSADYEDDEDGVEEYGSEGIANFSEVAQRMAAMGRGGDTVLGHLTPGELVIPKDLIESDPALKEGLFQRLRDMGVENPEQYVVGSEANSINPETGQPEFLKKFFRKVGKAVRNVVKGVVKVVKKIAPVVLPIIGSIFLGPIYGAALGSGVATLINGGSFKDALKSAAISGITGGVGAGVAGMVSGVGFTAGVKAAFNPANITAGIGAFKTSLTAGFSNAGVGFSTAKFGIAGGQQVNALLTEQAVQQAVAQGAMTAGQVTPQTQTTLSTDGVPQGVQQAVDRGSFTDNLVDAVVPGGKPTGQAFKDMFGIGSGSTVPANTMAAGNQAYVAAYENALRLPGMTDDLAAKIASNAMQNAVTTAATAAPTFLGTVAKYGIPLALAGGATALASKAGMFDPVPAEPAGVVERDPETGAPITGVDIVEQNPDDYVVADMAPSPYPYPDYNYDDYMLSNLESRDIGRGRYSVPTNFGTTIQLPPLVGSTPGGPFARPVTYAAEGGPIFPRRNGGIMPNEGVPGKDSVRAMLMPGEFVMTTDAVRGLGNGNLNKGIQNMYSVMRNLEGRGKAMA